MSTLNVWPETLRIRDTKIHDDQGGLGQRIYTTAGAGYEKRKYVRSDILEKARAELKRVRNSNRALVAVIKSARETVRGLDASLDLGGES